MPMDKVMELYDKKWSYKKIADYLYSTYKIKVSITTIHTNIKNYCIAHDIPIQKRISRPTMAHDEIVNANKNGISYKILAAQNGVSKSAIQKIVNEYKDPKTKRNYNPRQTFSVWKIIRDYENGLSIPLLAKKYNINKSTIKNRIEEYYTKIEGRKQKPKVLSQKTFYSLLSKCNKTGRTIDNMINFANENNIIIPQDYIDKYIQEQNKEREI